MRNKGRSFLKQFPTSETLSSSLSDVSDIYLRCSEYVSVSDFAGLELDVDWGVDDEFPISCCAVTLSILGFSVDDSCDTFCMLAFQLNFERLKCLDIFNSKSLFTH